MRNDPRSNELVRLSAAMNALAEKTKTENRGFTTDENSNWEKMVADYDGIKDAIEKSAKAEQIATHLNQPAIVPSLAASVALPAVDQRMKYAKAFNSWTRQIPGIELAQEERQVLQRGFRIDNTMSTGTGSQGGYTVPQGFSDQLEVAMKFFGGILGNVYEWNTEMGNPIPWPTLNDTQNTGRIIGQNTQVVQTDPANFGQVLFTSYIASSDISLVPYALLQDSYFDLNGLLANAMGERLGRLVNNKCTVGSGVGEPTGILTAAVSAGNIYTAPTGETTSIAPADFVNLEHTVDIAYRPGSKYMANDLTIKVIKNLKDSAGRPLWLPGNTGNLQDGIGTDRLNGYPLITNNDMPVMAANATSFLFGRMDKYKLRRVGTPPPSGDLPNNTQQIDTGVTLMRLTERYADYFQVGFVAFLRFDGNLVDAGSHPVAVFKNSAT